MTERRFTFGDMKKYSNMTANYFKSLGIGKGDKVMLVLKRHYQFWFAMMGLESSELSRFRQLIFSARKTSSTASRLPAQGYLLHRR